MTADVNSADPRLAVLRAYAAGELGTRLAIEQLGLRDFADLVIALSQHDLDLPKPPETAMRRAHLERARAILQPLLRE